MGPPSHPLLRLLGHRDALRVPRGSPLHVLAVRDAGGPVLPSDATPEGQGADNRGDRGRDSPDPAQAVQVPGPATKARGHGPLRPQSLFVVPHHAGGDDVQRRGFLHRGAGTERGPFFGQVQAPDRHGARVVGGLLHRGPVTDDYTASTRLD